MDGDILKPNQIKPRWRKVLSDLWGDKTRTALVVASIAVGVFAIGMIISSFGILSMDINASYAASNPANIEIWTDPFEEDLIRVIEKIPGVDQVEGRQEIPASPLLFPLVQPTEGQPDNSRDDGHTDGVDLLVHRGLIPDREGRGRDQDRPDRSDHGYPAYTEGGVTSDFLRANGWEGQKSRKDPMDDQEIETCRRGAGGGRKQVHAHGHRESRGSQEGAPHLPEGHEKRIPRRSRSCFSNWNSAAC